MLRTIARIDARSNFFDPQNLALPSVSRSGSTLTCTPGVWSEGSTVTRQWTRNGADIAGATGLTYTLLDADYGAQFAVRELATNGSGSNSATSVALYVGAYDNISVTYIGVFALNRVLNSYNGFCIRVRRSSDNLEANIGFTPSGDLDETALLAHTGSDSGFVVRIYRQEGICSDAYQNTQSAQPRIVNAGVVDKVSGRPTIVRTAMTQFLQTDSFLTPTAPMTKVEVLPTVSTGYTGVYCGPVGAVSDEITRWPADGLSYSRFGRTARTNAIAAGMPSTGGLVHTLLNDGSNFLLHRNNTLGATAALNGIADTTSQVVIRIFPVTSGLTVPYSVSGASVVQNLSDTDRQNLTRRLGAYSGITVI